MAKRHSFPLEFIASAALLSIVNTTLEHYRDISVIIRMLYWYTYTSTCILYLLISLSDSQRW